MEKLKILRNMSEFLKIRGKGVEIEEICSKDISDYLPSDRKVFPVLPRIKLDSIVN